MHDRSLSVHSLMFGGIFIFQVHIGDTRQPQTISSSVFEGVTHVICTTGTTAFPSKRWDGDNGPEQTGRYPSF